MRILFTCGGTAGHINPALGVAGRIRELMPDTEFLFVGADGHMETELVPREGFSLKTVEISGFVRSFKPSATVENVKTVWRVCRSTAESKKILREFRPDVAVGTGGYVCYPVLRAAASMGIPTAVHESNAVPGLTTKQLEGKIDRIMVGFEESREFYRVPEKIEITGTPVRPQFLTADRTADRRELGMDPEEPVVLAAFGSLGAGQMNTVMEEMLACMGEHPPFRLIYATGKRYYEDVRKRLAAKGISSPRIDVREYIYDMPRVMSAADIILCRSGASTMGELTCLGKPAILVPSPNVVNHHQEKNAAVLGNAGAARVMTEGSFDGAGLYEAVTEMLSDKPGLEAMYRASKKLGYADATDRIVSIVLGLAEKSEKRK